MGFYRHLWEYEFPSPTKHGAPCAVPTERLGTSTASFIPARRTAAQTGSSATLPTNTKPRLALKLIQSYVLDGRPLGGGPCECWGG